MNLSGSDLFFPRLLYLHAVKCAVSLCHRASSRHCTGPIRKSPYMGKTVSVFVQNVPCGGHHYIDSAYRRFSPTHGELAFTRLVLSAASLMRSFRWSTYYIFTQHTHGLQMPPQVKINWVRSGDLGGHSTGPRWPIYWPGNSRSKQRRTQTPCRMYGDLNRPVDLLTLFVVVITVKSCITNWQVVKCPGENVVS